MSLPNELASLSDRFSTVAAQADDSSFREPLQALMEAAEEVARAWSGSNLGFHANVYYAGLRVPPPGAHFSSEWGFLGRFQGTTGDWQEYPHDAVLRHIEESAGHPDLIEHQRLADEATGVIADARDDALSLLSASPRMSVDDHLRKLLIEVQEEEPHSYADFLAALMRSGQMMTRDSTAASQGIRPAPHQEVIAKVLSIQSPFQAATQLAKVCRRAARHLERLADMSTSIAAGSAQGGKIVIGHGGSPLWRELKDFISDRLNLDWDEFNRVPTAGVGTVDRLREMLGSASMAFLVATAEDESAEGVLRARQNVVHEIGLFQGRLGFGRAIVLLEEGCEEFSNIHGLGQIRFPTAHISACFEEVRRVLEREGLV